MGRVITHILNSIVASAMLALTLTGCAVNDPNTDSNATVYSHFYPLDNGLTYTYVRYNHSAYDTLSCSVIIGGTRNELNKLVFNTPSGPGGIFYYIGFTKDANGNAAASLSTDSSTLLALDGTLAPGATWVADPVHGVRATVVEHYDDYYLPGRTIDFTDVLAIKYHIDGQPDNVYTLRFFARDHGLILERQMVGPNTEIGSLQVLSINYPASIGRPDFHTPFDRHFSQSMQAVYEDGEPRK